MTVADPNAERFAAHLMGLKQALRDMPPDQRLLTVIATADELTDLYLEIAGLHRQFHIACENGTLPMTRPCGTA